MKKIFLSVFMVMAFMALPLQVLPGVEEFLSGKSWCGTVKENKYGTYPVYMSIQCLEKGGFCGTIQYPSLRCGGMLIYMGKTKGAHVFTEKIQWGRDKCYDGGRISISPGAEGSLKWLWFYPDGRLNVQGKVHVLR